LDKTKERVINNSIKHLKLVFNQKINEQKALCDVGAITIANNSLISSSIQKRDIKKINSEICKLATVFTNDTNYKDIELAIYNSKPALIASVLKKNCGGGS